MSSTLPSSTRIGFIGGGAMASAIAKGIAAAKLIPFNQMYVSDVHPSSLTELASLGMHTSTDNGVVASSCSVLFLCTKPGVLLSALSALSPRLSPSSLIISIAAGVPLSALESVLPSGSRVVRVMPNTPALVCQSASAYALGSGARKDDASLVHALLSAVGTAIQVEEKDLDAVTGLSGSGPAYIFLLIEALADGGVRAGLTRAASQQLALQTVLGSAKLMQQTGKHPGQLKDQVASPGGTTIAGLHALESGSFRATLMNAVVASTNRSKELGEAAKPKSKL